MRLAALLGLMAAGVRASGPQLVELANPRMAEHAAECRPGAGDSYQYAAEPATSADAAGGEPALGSPLDGLAPLGRASPATVEVNSTDGGLLFVFESTIAIGTPPQRFSIVPDTGSSQLWVRSARCSGCGLPAFAPQASTTYSSSGTPSRAIAYVDGTSISGVYSRDVVTVGGVSTSGFGFVEATRMDNTRGGLAGILGLSLRPPTADEDHFADKMPVNDPTLAPVFSYMIGETETAGTLVIGGMDLNRYSGPLMWLRVEPSSSGVYNYWQATIQSLTIVQSASTSAGAGGLNNATDSGRVVTFSDANSAKDIEGIEPTLAMFDTGTSLALFNDTTAIALNRALGLIPIAQIVSPGEASSDAPVSGTTAFGRACADGKIPADLPSVAITFAPGDRQLLMTSSEYLYVTRVHGKLVCQSAITGGLNDPPNTAIFGNAFLRRFYTVFDVANKRIGVAVANRAASNVTANLVAATSNNSPDGLASPQSVGGLQNVYPRTPLPAIVSAAARHPVAAAAALALAAALAASL